MNEEDVVMMIKNVSANVVVLEFTKSKYSDQYSNVPPNEDGTMFMGPNSVRTIEKSRMSSDKFEELRDRGILEVKII